MTMANGVRKSTGVIEMPNNNSRTMTIPHGLGTSKVVIIAQLVDQDHANVNSDYRYRNILVFGFTQGEGAVDTQQTYSMNNGNQLSMGTPYLSFYMMFGQTNAGSLTGATATDSTNGLFDVDGNSAYFNMNYQFAQGRWVWTAYAIG